MLTAKGAVTAALLTVVAALLLVGAVTQTILRHSIQVAPGVVLLLAGSDRRSWGPGAAMAVFAFWLFIMSLIWLFLLGLARVVTGQFSRVEVALTLVVGLASLAGLVAASRVPGLPGWRTRLAGFLLAGALQVGAMWLSLQPAVAAR